VDGGTTSWTLIAFESTKIDKQTDRQMTMDHHGGVRVHSVEWLFQARN